MPNRILRDGILSSERVAHLGWAEEVFYRRLMSVVDDYGRSDANPQLLRSRCYPLQTDDVPVADITRWLTACGQARLVFVYEVGGKTYLQLRDFRQQQRTPSKFPPPPDNCGSSAQHLLANDIKREQLPANAHLVGDGDGDGDGDDTPQAPKGAGAGDRLPEAEAAGGESPSHPGPGLNGHPAALLAAWNAIGLTQAVQLSGGRQKAANARLREPFFRDHYPAGLERVAKSAFCRGQNERQWKADLDWFLRPDTLPKILEGKYDDKAAGANRHPITGKPLPPTT